MNDGTAVTFSLPTATDDHTKPPYADPEINIVSCTRIGKVFGGGLGSNATVYGNPKVNINQIPGKYAQTQLGGADKLGSIGGGYDEGEDHVEGGVFGGGNEARVEGNTTVNIGNLEYVELVSFPKTDVRGYYKRSGSEGSYTYTEVTGDAAVAATDNTSYYKKVIGANILSNVYGGGNKADVGKYHEVYNETTKATTDEIDVVGNTYVNICAEEVTSGTSTTWQSVTPGAAGVTIGGKVFGGGKGIADSFRCGKAMVTGGTNVHIGNGTIGSATTGSNVYGGGEVGRVEGNAVVMIGLTPGTDETSAPHIFGNVYGAGSGVKTHGYSALLRGKTEVTIQSDAKVDSCVYGGGEIASVGRFKVKTPSSSDAPSWLPIGMPYSLWDATTESGKCTVIVQGNAEIGPDNMTMPVNTGHVFGAGKGVTPEVYAYTSKTTMPKRMMAYDATRYKDSYGTGEETIIWDYHSDTDHANVWEYFDTEAKYLTFVETMALVNKTDVTIDGDAFVKGSVYGGSENGQVKHDTHVKIKDGQIGCGKDTVDPYDDSAFIDPATTAVTTANALKTCASWTYVDNGLTYDKFANETGYDSKEGAVTATDGHTFYGNVFGGGSGYYPYAPGKWHSKAGVVGGNTRVDIEGGHILSCVYGGNEQTDVGSYTTDNDGAPHIQQGGHCIVNMKGGTIGVPRTADQIRNHPVIGNLFGAGKGDKRVLFNTKTNVASTRVNVTGGIVYGSVFGGGEDGHVLGNDTTIVSEANGKTITIGSTGLSGADGNVFGGGRGSETALTAGVVGGNVRLTIESGNILGSVYGGGRLASVGTNFVNPNNTELYGALQTPAADHGNIIVTISGGTIGAADSNGKLLASDNSNGDVFGGSKGTASNFKLGIVRSTTINMTGGTAYASVYGGGELAQVVGSHTTSGQDLGTEINISGGTIGIQKDKLPASVSSYGAKYGNVYGGGEGNTANFEAGLIKTNTKVKIENGTNTIPTIYHNIYGGGAYGSVGDITRATTGATYVPGKTAVLNMPTAWATNTGKAEVYVYGGTIGVDGKENGMVFASSRGDVSAPEGATVDAPFGTDVDKNDRLAWVYETKLVIGGENKTPIIKGSVYGSGENGHVFTDASVEIHNGTIGIHDGSTKDATRGNVYGGGCGEDTYKVGTGENKKEYYNPLAGIVLGKATVTMDGGTVKHNIYGAGALGSVDNTVIEISGGTVGHDGIDNGNVYGAARGKVDATQTNIAQVRTTAVSVKPNADASKTANIKGSVFGGGQAGIVQEDVMVNILGGQIDKDVYGGGALANTQTSSWDAASDTWASGKSSTSYKTYVNLLGGKILGAAYGGALGDASKPAYVYGDTKVNLNGLEAASDIDATTLGSLAGDGKPMVANGAGYKMREASTGAIVNRIFGANNVNGSPKGNVKVHVFGTQNKGFENIGTKNTKHGRLEIEPEGAATTYDVIAVYGGGNEAAYVPVYNQTTGATDYKTQVIIEGCSETSIKTVYGGGNAASVPETNVLVKSAYEIEQVFGGGNGKDKKSDGSDNPGADIGQYKNGTSDVLYGTGNANSTIEGGYVHELFGASNEKGTIKGKITLKNTQVGTSCTLKIDKIYNAGRNADVEGDVNVILDCQPNEKVLEYYCGAENANVKGNVDVTITNGHFGKVFGGNNQSGAIFGHIKLNIVETGCQPIIIDELYGCGNDAAYSVYGYKQDGTIDGTATGKPKYVARTSMDDGTAVTFGGKPHTVPPYADPEINIISATRIGKVFGGGLGTNATVYGNPTVNINQIPGKYALAQLGSADKLGSIGGGYYEGEDYVEGGVYGGGNEAQVVGNTTVNIDTEKYVYSVITDTEEPVVGTTDVSNYYTLTVSGTNQNPTYTYNQASGTAVDGTIYYERKAVQGANITGNVFGAGKGKDNNVETALVSGDATVNMAGGEVKKSVYGGGELSQVSGDTHVTVSGGTIGTAGQSGATYGNIYGGGFGSTANVRLGLIKGNTNVTVENRTVGENTITPTILHNVYGGGAYGSVGTYNYASEAADAVISSLKTANTGVANITIKGGTIGTTGQENGMIYGSSRGDVDAPGSIQDKLAWVYDTHVTIGTSGQGTTLTTPLIMGSVYGSGENGHTFNDTEVIVHSGTVGIKEGSPIANPDDAEHPYTGAGYPNRGNLYGGGCGTDKYYQDPTGVENPYDGNGQLYNPLAGIVYGDTQVTIDGGLVVHNVYGAGAMGTVGKSDAGGTTGGKTTIDISGGTIGVSGTVGDGNVFGAARGDKEYTATIGLAQVRETKVTISSGQVMGNVYGGGEVGNVGVYTETTPKSVGNYNWDTSNTGSGLCTVIINGGKIGPDNAALSKNYGNVYGGGKGVSNTFECEKAMVYKTNVTISNNSIVNGTVYGGGEVGRVENNTVVTIGTANGTDEPEIKGNVFAAGAGTKTHGYSALVRGTSSATIQGKAKVLKNVYGGGEEASVGRYKVKTPANENDPDVPKSLPYGMPAHLIDGGTSTVVIKDNAVIGTDGVETTGHVYGAGQGVDPHEVAYTYENDATKPSRMVSGNTWEYFANEDAYLQFVETLALTGTTDVTIDEDATIRGSVFGGSESGFVYHDTNVKIKNGTINGDAFGGGRGLVSFAESGRVSGNTNIAISDGAVHGNVYGGGNLGDVGTIYKAAKDEQGNLTYNFVWRNKEANGNISATDMNNIAENNKITGTNKNTGICNVTISGGKIGLESTTEPSKHGNVFGAGRGSSTTWWCEKAIAYATNVSVSDGTVYGTVYGGGEVGRVEDDAKVTIGSQNEVTGKKPDIRGSVFGAGAGLHTHGYSALVRGNTNVTVQGSAQVGGSVYGGGETASVGKFTVVGGLPKHPYSGGYCTVLIQDRAKVGSDGTGHNVYGACKGVDPTTISADERKSMQLFANRPKDASGNYKAEGDGWSYYETYPEGYTGTKFVWVNYTDDYPAFLRTLALTSHPTVTIAEDATVNGSVYGGGERGITLGDVAVNMTGGTVNQDVYGGGALADTNTGNWDADKNTWNEDKINTDGSTAYKTIVNLTGGYVKGDAYGGGLGDLAARGTGHSDIAAMVYGDVFVTLGTLPTTTGSTTTPGTATKFYIGYYDDDATTTDDDESLIVKSGRVFGCNNLNGSPLGNVTVTINKTVPGNKQRTDEDPNNTGRPPMGENASPIRSYELAAVYGGGNLADYVPAEGKKPMVRLNTCDISVEEVYGGGNAAKVPETDVLILGAYEIENVFGGGNGEDKYTLNGTSWIPNPGADVDGNANTLMKGGYIHQAYGASNSKGNISGSVYIDKTSGGMADCPVQVDKMVAAGNNADVNGDVKVFVGCQGSDKTPMVFYGADNANVNGNVEVTITSGNFGKMFAGNNIGGAIRGHIILNIEETSECEPIRIDELYLGGNKAAYSVYGYYVETNLTKDNGTGTSDPDTETAELDAFDRMIFKPRTSASDPRKPVKTYNRENNTWTVYDGTYDSTSKTYKWTVDGVAKEVLYDQPVLNVISCTEIKEVFGGGYGEGADMYANPTVNINMIPGYHAKKIDRDGDKVADNNEHALGIIGHVYGGGNQAAVVGDATINIGTAKTVTVKSMTYDATTKEYTAGTATVEGAYITGNVYGGGKLADVGVTHLGTDTDGNTIDVIDAQGNTFVNIGASRDAVLDSQNKPTGEYEYHAVAITGAGYEGVKVLGSVFGGGKGEAAESGDGAFRCGKAMVTGGTNVCIGNGTIGNFDANGKLLSGGFVFGGGEVGRVEENTRVTIGIGDGDANKTSAPVIGNDVFGAGKGEKTHGYAALVRGNTYVTIQGDAKLKESVYGGGEIASVGRYNVVKASDLTDEFKQEHPELEVGMPWSLANSTSGNCYVVVRGNAEIGPDTPMQMTATGGPDDTGHVFGAGKGVLPYEGYSSTDPSWHVTATPWRMQPNNEKEEYGDGTNAGTEAKYLAYIETLALATQTDVTIGGNAFVKGSVYGGSENGHVQHSTHVTIAGGQIGAGEGMNERYTGWPTETEDITTSWKECAHWDYDPMDAAPWDPYATYKNPADGKSYYDAAYTQTAEGGFHIAKDGHSFYGNVYGGGSGLIPYAPGKWHRAAGSVGGNTTVDITGGHILTSVYGGNEQTDVGTYRKDEAHNNALTIPVRDGKCTINMTGGTIGVPRTAEDTKKLPVNCYLFGAGKGDPRIFFNTWTNVIETEVNISGDARIYGSSFGGGEDGHVINNAVTNIGGTVVIGTGTAAKTYTENGVLIGSTGLSYVDGNVFGGGRGFTGDAQTAGTVGGNVVVNFSGGKILGSVYGGGRLASVGTLFTAPDDDNYGNFQEDAAGKSYGHVTINISGGTIGRDFVRDAAGKLPAGAEHSGNVFGGSMGRLDLLNGTRNPIWPKMAQVKTSAVNVYGTAEIKRNVFGGGELGTVRDNASVVIGGYLNPNVSDGSKTTFIVNPSKNDSTITVPASDNAPIVCRDVYGGGYGSEDRTHTIFSVMEPNSTNSGYEKHMYAFTPMQFAGGVGRNTFVDIKGGQVRKSVYGGGEMASVGIINCQVETLASPGANRIFVGQKDGKDYYHTSIFKNEDKQTVDGKEVVYGFALSCPFKFSYMPGFYGGTHVNITGGRIGAKTSDPDIQTDNGDVYGAGEGIAGDYKEYAFCANVGATDVNINMNSDGVTATNFEGGGNCISGAVYGGGENGHVMGDTRLTLVNGFVGHSIYGAGSGKGKFETELVKIGKDPASAAKEDHYKREIYSVTAGKVFGNSTINMSGGTVIRNVYGGGNMGSVGKGNYSGGLDDYSTAGYGETLNGNLWDNVSDDSKAFLSTGICTVNITGGTIGYIDPNDPSNTMYPWKSDSSLPYGNVFGGCRGESAPNIAESPRYLYSPEFFIGYVNETNVTIGADDGSGPTILGSVYGGGMDGHVRRDASVTIKGGEIGIPYTSDNKTKVKTDDMNNIQWLARGNVYGSGSGIGKYEYDFNYDNDFDDTVNYNNGRATVATKERDYSSSAGSVTRFTKVMVNGGTIHRNVYGGGSLSSIGAPKIGQSYLEYRKGDTTGGVGKQTLNQVVISGGNIGDKDSNDAGYGGHVFGGSRGDASLDNSTFSTSMFTDVAVKGGKVFGSVFGGGEVGIVKGSVDVNVTGGEVVKDVYGGGALANTNTANPEGVTSTYTTTVNLLGGTIGDAYGGGLGQRIGDVNGGKSNIEAIVYGDVNVNLNGLEASDYVADAHSSYVTGLDKVDGAFTTYRTDGGCVVLGNVFGCNNINGTPYGHAKVHVFKTMPRTGKTYDVDAVFGGGDAADYVPADTKQSTEVIIEGCDLTSIEQVYAGGNAAAVPGSSVLVKGTKIINELFGGGNGERGAEYAANVGYHYDAATNTRTNYALGTGKALVQLMAGKINYVYGGSNSNGDIRGGASTSTPSVDHSAGCCDELVTKQISGGGKNADMEGGADIVIDCRNSSAWVEDIYAGSENADVGGDVRLTITSGKFKRVFGGNKSGGKLNGSITVNIEESPSCGIPVIIGELYAGGNRAPYSIYGYDEKGEMLKSGTPKHHNPVLNVRAFTSIGNIYGGGFGEQAEMFGSPTVNINSVEVDHTDKSNTEFQGNKYNGETCEIIDDPADESKNYSVVLLPHEDGKMGVIGNVFGGGNAAKVNGDTNVNIGTKFTDVFHTPVGATDEERTHKVAGADIRGNVYGGGNNAEVTGNTNVVIGTDGTSTTTTP